MTDIKIIEKHQFDNGDYALRIGEYASYNTYYVVTAVLNSKTVNIGLQISDTGISPQVGVINNRILIGAANDFYAWDGMAELKHYGLNAPFYQWCAASENIIIIHELGVIALNKSLKKIWERSFSEIIDLEKIVGNTIVLQDYNGTIIKINVATGDLVE